MYIDRSTGCYFHLFYTNENECKERVVYKWVGIFSINIPRVGAGDILVISVEAKKGQNCGSRQSIAFQNWNVINFWN